ncbi:MAG: methyl-accepting chemotaxis protein [Geobacter sp.]|nr:methyl-accepting chemotaxis protein [Geobacter sp.]
MNSISGKLLAVIAACVVVFGIVMGAYLIYFRGQLVADRSAAIGKRLQGQVDTQIEGKLHILLTNAISIAHNAKVVEALQKNDFSIAETELRQVIKEFEQADFKGTGFHVVRSNMTSFWRSFMEKRDDDVSFREMVKNVASHKKPLWGIEVGRVGVGLRAMVPINDASGSMVGMVETIFGVGSVSRYMQKEKAFYILLVDKAAVDAETFIKQTSDVEVGGKYFTANKKWFDEATVAFAKSADITALQKNRTQLDSKYFYAVTEAKDMNGKVYGLHLTGMPRAEYDKQIKPVFRLANNLLIAVGVMAVIAGCVIILMLKRVVAQPIISLSSFLLTLDNDLTKRFVWKSNDEIGQVSESVNELLSRLQQVLGLVVSESAQVTAAAAQLSSASDVIASGVEAVVEQASSVATASEEMAATSADIANNCMIAVEGAQSASEAAVAGSGVVSSTIAGMEQIADRVRSSAQTVRSLGDRSEQIGAIAGTIEDIADQTNLLALNAAIEAARAGEMGRGFAVVADEVRALAERTTRATREIGEMIKAIQNETRAAVQQMELGVNEVERGTEDASRSGEALQEILSRINDVTMQINQIATAAEEQTATTGEIAGNVSRINDVAQDSSNSAHQSATSATQLAALAEELQRQVKQFRV